MARGPSRAAREARATKVSDDIFADRNVLNGGATGGPQTLAEDDRRKRVNHSVKFYIVQLVGSWIHVSESAERVVHYQYGLRWVTFEGARYELKHASKFKGFLSRFIQGGCYAYVGGIQIDNLKQIGRLTDQQFIYITSSAALKKFNELKL